VEVALAMQQVVAALVDTELLSVVLLYLLLPKHTQLQLDLEAMEPLAQQWEPRVQTLCLALLPQQAVVVASQVVAVAHKMLMEVQAVVVTEKVDLRVIQLAELAIKEVIHLPKVQTVDLEHNLVALALAVAVAVLLLLVQLAELAAQELVVAVDLEQQTQSQVHQ
jgi:hypothetical protein